MLYLKRQHVLKQHEILLKRTEAKLSTRSFLPLIATQNSHPNATVEFKTGIQSVVHVREESSYEIKYFDSDCWENRLVHWKDFYINPKFGITGIEPLKSYWQRKRVSLLLKICSIGKTIMIFND